MFDIYFSIAHGFEIDFPFLHFWISSEVFIASLVVVIVLRVRKLFLGRKRNKIETPTESEFDWNF